MNLQCVRTGARLHGSAFWSAAGPGLSDALDDESIHIHLGITLSTCLWNE